MSASEKILDLYGRNFGRYHIGKKLGEGGYAVVYRATEPDLGRDVALKILKPNEKGEYGETVKKRFLREGRMVAGLKNRHAIQVYNCGEQDGLLYLAFEYVEGETLAQRLKREGALPPLRVIQMLEQILEALEEAHERGILHRDIKPANIMVFDHERRGLMVKLLDFGIGKFVREQNKITQLTMEGLLVGTPRYMSPEQMRETDKLGPSCDIWGVGMVAYEALSGRKAIESSNFVTMTARIMDDSKFELPEDLEIPVFLREMVAKMLKKDVTQRYQSASEILADLEEFKIRVTVEQHQNAHFDGIQAFVEDETETLVPSKRNLSAAKVKRIAAMMGVCLILGVAWWAVSDRFAQNAGEAAAVDIEEPALLPNEQALQTVPEASAVAEALSGRAIGAAHQQAHSEVHAASTVARAASTQSAERAKRELTEGAAASVKVAPKQPKQPEHMPRSTRVEPLAEPASLSRGENKSPEEAHANEVAGSGEPALMILHNSATS